MNTNKKIHDTEDAEAKEKEKVGEEVIEESE